MIEDEDAAARRAAARAGDPHSPWRRHDGWRLTGPESRILHFLDNGTERAVGMRQLPAAHRIEIDGRSAELHHSRLTNGDFAIELGGERWVATVAAQPGSITVGLADETCRLVVRDPLAPAEAADVAVARLTAPMPGKILAVHVAPGARVERGQLLMVLEAMKMEHAITAPAAGVVSAVHYAAGDVVEEGALLLSFAAAERS